jgi:hypothetical protein
VRFVVEGNEAASASREARQGGPDLMLLQGDTALVTGAETTIPARA